MTRLNRGTHVVIHRHALQHNLQQARQKAPSSKVWAVIKANAYGHGALEVSKTLEAQADGFAVASLDEALELKQSGAQIPILLLEGCLDLKETRTAIEQGFQIVVHQPAQVQWLIDAKPAKTVYCWIKLDTGMHRLGFAADSGTRIQQQLIASELPLQLSFMSHFACADLPHHPLTDQQLTAFQPAIDSGLPCSMANSAAILSLPQSHLDWIRAGIMLYGTSPFAEQSAAELNLKPAMDFISRVIGLRTVREGETVGYGGRWTAKRDSLIATLSVGYGDGYPRHAPDGTPVWIQGEIVPMTGRVSMDMITIDVTDVPGVEIGSMAELWGSNLSVDDVASHVGTISYELLTRILPRVPVSYH